MLRQLTAIVVAAEHVQIGCQIITSCVLLGKAAFLQQYGGAVLHSLQAMIGKFARLLSTKILLFSMFEAFQFAYMVSLERLSGTASLSYKSFAAKASK